jgi:hypothetical protein
MRHTVKLLILIPALGFLLWWGWSGNFAFNRPSLFTLFDQKSFYNLEFGRTSMGYARREIKTEPKSKETTIMEDSVINLSFAGQPFLFKTSSQTVFSDDGNLISAIFSLPLGHLGGQAKAVVEDRTLKCQISIAGVLHEAEVGLPPSGPILVSGLIPWLAHQSNVPLGRPIGLSLLDPVSMTFKPAELTVEDATDIADELGIFKLTLHFMGTENSEWVDAHGQLLRQYNPGFEIGLYLSNDEQALEIDKELQEALAKETKLPDGPLASLISGFLANNGLEALGKAISQGGQATPWTKVEAEPKGEPEMEPQVEPEGESEIEPEAKVKSETLNSDQTKSI